MSYSAKLIVIMLQFRNNFGNDDYDANDGHDHKNDSDKMLITVGFTIVGSPR